ncbi:MAG: hypothetical protein ACR2KE_03620 [Candidatus Nanopelagicales bacterium]
MPRLLMRATVTLSALAFGLATASVAQAKPIDPTTADRVMMSDAQATTLGFGADAVRSFSKSTTRTDPVTWPQPMCTTPAGESVNVPVSRLIYTTTYMSAGLAMRTGGQAVIVFPTVAEAATAWATYREKSALCTGTFLFTINGDTVTVTTTTGEETLGKEKWFWVRTESSGQQPADTYSQSSFVTYRLIGTSIQQVLLYSVGDGTPPNTDAQISSAKKLTVTLGNAWKKAFGS